MNRFKMNTLKDYYEQYLRYHVLLLADVFEKIRKIRLKGCGQSLSDSTLSWDAMLNMKKVELDFVSDSYMYLFFEKAIRGRVSYISKRYSKANNKHLKSDDLTQE